MPLVVKNQHANVGDLRDVGSMPGLDIYVHIHTYIYLFIYVCMSVLCVLCCFSHVQLFEPHGLYPARLLCPLSMGILQARILKWVAMPSSRGSFQPRDKTQVSHTAGRLYRLSHRGSPYRSLQSIK